MNVKRLVALLAAAAAVFLTAGAATSQVSADESTAEACYSITVQVNDTEVSQADCVSA